MRTYYVYILTDRCRKLLYTGMTNHLERRLHEHRTQRNDSYTSRYGIHYLVYFEVHAHRAHACARERMIKEMPRAAKDELVRRFEEEERGLPLRLRNPYAPPTRE